MSEDAMSNTRKLLIIIHGSGVVRAGQWSRKYVRHLFEANKTSIYFEESVYYRSDAQKVIYIGHVHDKKTYSGPSCDLENMVLFGRWC